MNNHFISNKNKIYGVWIFIFLISIQGCDSDLNVTGVHSDDPGRLQLYISSSDSDDFIVITGDTARVGDGINDSLALTIGQGRAYRGSDFAVLFKSLDEYREFSETYNIIEKEAGNFKKFLIFETYLPPATYDSIKVTITADYVQIGTFQIPIEMPPGVNHFLKIVRQFDMNKNRVTEIHLELKQFQSMVRIGDAYHFFRIIEVVEIKYL